MIVEFLSWGMIKGFFAFREQSHQIRWLRLFNGIKPSIMAIVKSEEEITDPCVLGVIPPSELVPDRTRCHLVSYETKRISIFCTYLPASDRSFTITSFHQAAIQRFEGRFITVDGMEACEIPKYDFLLIFEPFPNCLICFHWNEVEKGLVERGKESWNLNW
jgi:hypothetical protein